MYDLCTGSEFSTLPLILYHHWGCEIIFFFFYYYCFFFLYPFFCFCFVCKVIASLLLNVNQSLVCYCYLIVVDDPKFC